MTTRVKGRLPRGARKPVAGIILAAGQSTRMITDLPKVLHEVCGRPMLDYVIDACRSAGIEDLYVVVGYGRDEVIKRYNDVPNITWVDQAEQKGTGHAVMCCREFLGDFEGDCVVVCGDGPLLRPHTLKELIERHNQAHSYATLATAVLRDPTGYGRILRDAYGNLVGIVEHADCTAEQRKITEINPSYYCFDCQTLFWAIEQVRPDNVKKEYYLTDALKIIIQSGKSAIAITAVDPEEILSINSRRDLAEVSKVMQARIQEDLMSKGVTIVDPVNTWIDARAQIGRDTVIYPFTYIQGRVRIGRNCQIGPFAYVREGTTLEEEVVLGVFTEVKNSRLGQEVRARHHSYIGDARVGRRVNIGAGTIFANYDGTKINQTEVGDDTFVGSGSILVAPLSLKPNAHIQPGTVVRNNSSEPLGAEPENYPSPSVTGQ